MNGFLYVSRLVSSVSQHAMYGVQLLWVSGESGERNLFVEQAVMHGLLLMAMFVVDFCCVCVCW